MILQMTTWIHVEKITQVERILWITSWTRNNDITTQAQIKISLSFRGKRKENQEKRTRVKNKGCFWLYASLFHSLPIKKSVHLLSCFGKKRWCRATYLWEKTMFKHMNTVSAHCGGDTAWWFTSIHNLISQLLLPHTEITGTNGYFEHQNWKPTLWFESQVTRKKIW